MTRSGRFVISFSLLSGTDCWVACVLTIITPLTCGISLQVYSIFLFIRVFSLENDSCILIMTGIYAEGKFSMTRYLCNSCWPTNRRGRFIGPHARHLQLFPTPEREKST